MKLRTLAIAAYENSPLNEKDLEEQALLVNEIALYLARFGVEKEAVNSNPFEIDEVHFHAQLHADNDGPYEYEVRASRRCASCPDFITKTVSKRWIHPDEEDSKEAGWLSVEEFGQWLLKPHLCASSNQRPNIGK